MSLNPPPWDELTTKLSGRLEKRVRPLGHTRAVAPARPEALTLRMAAVLRLERLYRL